MDNGWIGVDFDGTLAEYSDWKGPAYVGNPIPKMVDRVKQWLEDGKDVRIFTARVDATDPGSGVSRDAINSFCLKVFNRTLPITNIKNKHMIELWDDRAVQVIPNTGDRVDGED